MNNKIPSLAVIRHGNGKSHMLNKGILLLSGEEQSGKVQTKMRV